jgi:arginine utilization protein RocB
VLFLFPPFYPAAPPRAGLLAAAMRPVLDRHETPLRGAYPFISDASYVAWRAEQEHVLAPYMPALGREYRLPFAAAAALDLDVVNLGPWGRGAHGLYERVHAPHAFATLPRLVAEVVHAALDA